MGNGLSVSSIVDKLHALESEARSAALDDLCEQHHEIKLYLKTKYLEDSSPKPSRPSHLQVLSINEPVPDEQKLIAKYAPWSKDVTFFWTSAPFTLIPEETSYRPLRFIYDATVRQHSENHESCLRSRYLALFWFDYFRERYPGKGAGFDQDYIDLGREIAGVETNANDSMISTLREQVKAGRRYNKLTERFGNGILLILPSSIGRSTLEQKLPLGDHFETFVSLLVKNGWEKLAKTTTIESLGASIRRSLLVRCFTRQVHGLSEAPSISSQKSAKRKAQYPQSPQAASQKSKKQKTQPANATIRSRTTSISTNSPATPRILQQVYRLEGFGSSKTHQANPHLGPATPAQATDANDVAVHPEDISRDHDDGTSTQPGDERALHLCGGGSLPLAASTSAADWGRFGYAMYGTQDQDREGASRSAHYITNQRATEESGDMTLPDGTETTSKSGESNAVQREEDPMLSNLSAEDWENCDVRVFIPVPFEPVSFESDPLLGTSSSPI